MPQKGPMAAVAARPVKAAREGKRLVLSHLKAAKTTPVQIAGVQRMAREWRPK